jgi:putative membrane protein
VEEAPPTTGSPRPDELDYRFTLANERTFLAYVRTALGLDAGGLAAAQFLRPGTIHLRLVLAVFLVALGFIVAVLGFLRWQTTEEAMRRNAPLPRLRLPLVLASGLAVVSVAALVLVISGR